MQPPDAVDPRDVADEAFREHLKALLAAGGPEALFAEYMTAQEECKQARGVHNLLGTPATMRVIFDAQRRADMAAHFYLYAAARDGYTMQPARRAPKETDDSPPATAGPISDVLFDP